MYIFYIFVKGVTGSLSFWANKLACNGNIEQQWEFKSKFIDRLRKSDIAEQTDKANEQHYEVPTDYYLTVSDYYHVY